MNFLFFKLSTLNIFRPTYWARIFMTVIQGFLLMPVYFLVSKFLLGCSEFNTLNNDGTLKWLYALFVLVLLLANYCYYNLARIKSINRKYRNYKGIASHIRLVLIILLFIVWIVKAETIVSLFIKMPSCQ